MKKYMVDILLVGLEMETRMALLPKEQEVLQDLINQGVVQANYIKLDMSGIFMVVVAQDEDDMHQKLATLPYYPYMKLSVVGLRHISD
jgi:muconolactone delta-isomerase